MIILCSIGLCIHVDMKLFRNFFLVFLYILLIRQAQGKSRKGSWPHDHKLRKYLSLKLDFEYLKFY